MAKKEIKNNKDKTSFVKSFKAELKKVIWPTPKQLFNNTVAVLAIVLITTLIVFVLDITFETINKNGIDKIKEKVSNSVVENTVTSEENSIEDNTISEEDSDDETIESTNSESTTESTEAINTEIAE
jgi:preprotein translocase SecE subunit